MPTKLNATNISILYRIFDFLSIFLGLYISFYILDIYVKAKDLIFIGLVINCIFILLCEMTDFYRNSKGMHLGKQIRTLITRFFITYIVTFLIFNFSSPHDFNNHTVALGFLITCTLTILSRMMLRVCYKQLKHLGIPLQKTLVIGNTDKAFKILEEIKYSEWRGYQNLGIYSFSNHDHQKFSGNIDDVISLVKKNQVDKIYIVIDQVTDTINKSNTLLNIIEDSTCSAVIIPDIFRVDYLYTKVEDLNGIPLIPLIDTNIEGINKLLKRCEDIILSILILILISPILIMVAFAIKTTSKGPILFKQYRYGLNGKSIQVYKFRSMKVMENGNEVKQATKNDPRVTKVGAFIRRTSLDELPQFFNVLLGTMSIVGPRPHAVSHNEQYRKLIPGYMLRHKVKPGITGWAQINGWRGETDTLDKMEKRIEFDLYYIKNWSIWLDLKIIFLTVFKGFINKAAY